MAAAATRAERPAKKALAVEAQSGEGMVEYEGTNGQSKRLAVGKSA